MAAHTDWAFVSRQAEAVIQRRLGRSLEAICRRFEISEVTFYRWLERYERLEAGFDKGER